MPSASNWGTAFARGTAGQLGKSFLYSGREETPGQEASLGVPRMRNILNSSSISESPGKSGVVMAISAKMHPTDHMSTAVE